MTKLLPSRMVEPPAAVAEAAAMSYAYSKETCLGSSRLISVLGAILSPSALWRNHSRLMKMTSVSGSSPVEIKLGLSKRN